MVEILDPVFLARVQFAFTVSFHIIFPSFTIGLASWLAVLQWRWMKTGNQIYADVYNMWLKIFAVAFGMGVVSGVVLSFQFGTNWSVFSDAGGNIIGPLLGYEVLTAFFLEAFFIGIMLFGKGRVSPGIYFVSTVLVAAGTLISAFWILSANSWMQTPVGFRVGGEGILYPTDWMEIIFNPSFSYRFVHMVMAAYLTTAFGVAGVGSFYLLRRKYTAQARIMLGTAMVVAVFVSPLQLVFGDMHGLNTFEHQPAKVAAMEGLWETTRGAPLLLFGWPDQKAEKTRYAVEIPKLSSLILTHDFDGEVRGLKEWPENERPPAATVFWTFRIMVGLGLLMIATGAVAVVLYFRRRLFDMRWFHYWCMWFAPSGFIAVLAGWFVTEVGRQPWMVQGVLRTGDAASPVAGTQVAVSLAAFILVYVFVFAAGSYYILHLIRKGPADGEQSSGLHGMEKPSIMTDRPDGKGGGHVQP